MRIGKRALFLALTLAVFICLLPEVYATKGVQLDKAKVRFLLKPESSYSGRIEVSNPGEEAKELRVYLEDWSYENSEGAKNFFPANSSPLSCASWISYAPAEFTIPAFGKEYVNFIVNVPKQAKGGHVAILFFESSESKVDQKSKEDTTAVVVPIAVRVGSLFFVEVEGTVKRQAEIEKFSLQKDAADEPLYISLDLRNSGNTDITAKGNYNIMNDEGMVVARGEFNDVYTLPNDLVKLTASWKDTIAKGKYSFVITLDLGKSLEEFALGRGPVITKEAEIEIGEKGKITKVGELK
jgi:hypothetical protein